MIEIIIVDDCPKIINSIESLFKDNPKYKIVLIASNGLDCLIKFQTAHISPSIAIVDINMPKMDGVSLTHFLSNHNNNIKVIGISVLDNVDGFSAILEAGAKGFVCKFNLISLPVAIETVLNGQTYIDPDVSDDWKNYQHFKKPNNDDLPLYNFTSKEIEHLQLIPTDLTIEEIAQITNQSTHTVNQHQKDIKKKTGFATRTSQVMFGIKQGLVKVFRA